MTSKNTDLEALHLLYGLTGNYPYNPPSYTCIQEFTDNFPKTVILEFAAIPNLPVVQWQPESPYPKIYTKDYRKSIVAQHK